MRFFLDTNICIYFLKGQYSSVRTRLLQLHPDEVKICSIVKAELEYGAAKSQKSEDNLQKVHDFLFPFEIVPFGGHTTIHYAKIRASLEGQGRPIGPNDLIIAATVLEHDGTLITNNVEEFRRIENLRMGNWVTE